MTVDVARARHDAGPDLHADLRSARVWSDADVRDLPLVDTELVSVGGGLASFALVDVLRVAGVKTPAVRVGGDQLIEDVEHDFVCVGIDKRNRSADVFNLHFQTPFWSPAGNPMATPSTLVKGWAMFGSTIVLGEINVD